MTDQPRGNTREASGPLVSTFANDPDMSALVELFVQDLPERVRTLEEGWNSKALADVRRVAHQLKGASSGYGFADLGDLAGRLEAAVIQLGDSVDDQALRSVREKVEELLSACRRVRVR